MRPEVLGLQLDDALRRLDAVGIRPVVVLSHAPRRGAPDGAQCPQERCYRVVRVRDGGRHLTACAFENTQKAEYANADVSLDQTR